LAHVCLPIAVAAELPTMIVLEIVLIALALIFFFLMDRYAAGCEKI
jgi:hypothetical protein